MTTQFGRCAGPVWWLAGGADFVADVAVCAWANAGARKRPSRTTVASLPAVLAERLAAPRSAASGRSAIMIDFKKSARSGSDSPAARDAPATGPEPTRATGGP